MSNEELKQKIQKSKSVSEHLDDLNEIVMEQLLPVFMALTVKYMEADEEKRTRLRLGNPELFKQFIGMLEKGKSIIENRSKYCGDCGIVIDREDVFCKRCGREII